MFSFGALGLRARLARNLPIGAFWMTTGSTALMEIAAEAAPDAIVIDAQHGLWDRQSLEHAVGLVSSRVPVLVRTADASAISISQALDTGAEGVIVPLIETAEPAAAAAAAARFPPHGQRSGGGVRPLMRDFARYYAAANDRTVVGVMIETQGGVQNAAAIANTKGIDFVFIGTGDLAISLGGFPNVDKRHEEACQTVLKACKEAGVPCGVFTMSAEAAAKRRDEGYAFVTVADDIGVASRGFTAAMTKFQNSGRV
jgi:2-keto-3-deoxy-L-rhamnonate aldolase RhmA